MLTKTEKTFSFLFIAILIAELVTGSNEKLFMLHYIAKPSLLIALIIFFWMRSNDLSFKVRNLTLLALSFSLLGDCLLMFVDQSSQFFISGLIAFLIAHVFYIIVFLKSRNKSKSPFGFIMLMLIYGLGLFYLLKNGLADMLIPVVIYMLVILTMSTSSFLRRGKVSHISFNLVFLGAILFMISDSLLALNKFYKPLPWSDISIMLTYALAQLSLVFGILKQR